MAARGVDTGPTTYEWTLRGTDHFYRLTNWTTLSVAQGNSWLELDRPAPAPTPPA